MVMNEALKACPFCGASAIIEAPHGTTMIRVGCSSAFARGTNSEIYKGDCLCPFSEAHYHPHFPPKLYKNTGQPINEEQAKAIAIAAWNTRTPPPFTILETIPPLQNNGCCGNDCIYDAPYMERHCKKGWAVKAWVPYESGGGYEEDEDGHDDIKPGPGCPRYAGDSDKDEKG